MSFGTVERTRRIVPELEDLELGWVAGLIEGEGCFYVSNRRIRLCVTSIDRDTLDRLRELVCVGRIYGPKKTSANNDYWEWAVQSKWDVADIAAQIYPLMSKRRRAKIRSCLKDVGLRSVV